MEDPYDLPFPDLPDRRPPGRPGYVIVVGGVLAARPTLDRNSAITAMVLADHAGERDLNEREAARLTGLSRDLLYDQMRLSNLACVKVGMWCLITCQDLQQFLGIVS